MFNIEVLFIYRHVFLNGTACKMGIIDLNNLVGQMLPICMCLISFYFFSHTLSEGIFHAHFYHLPTDGFRFLLV